MKPKEETNMTVRMKTKQDDYKIEFVEILGSTEEKSVTIWFDSRSDEYLVSNSPQTLLGYSPHHTRVYSGPYSQWIHPMSKEDRQASKEREKRNNGE
jgi:hypothetical protein